MKKQNAKIRKMANRIHLTGTVILMTCILMSTYLYLTDQAPVKGLLGIVFTGLVIFIVMRGVAWLVGGFQQKTYTKEKPTEGAASTVSPEDDPTEGSRFLHEKKKNPFMPE